MSNSDKSEPTMDEILASIRRIIADDSEPEAVNSAPTTPAKMDSGDTASSASTTALGESTSASGLSAVIGAGAAGAGLTSVDSGETGSTAPSSVPPPTASPSPAQSFSRREDTSASAAGHNATSHRSENESGGAADEFESPTNDGSVGDGPEIDKAIVDTEAEHGDLETEFDDEGLDFDLDTGAASAERGERRGRAPRERPTVNSRRAGRETQRRRPAFGRSNRDEFPELPDIDNRSSTTDVDSGRGEGATELDDDALELTEVVTEDGSVVSLNEARARAGERAARGRDVGRSETPAKPSNRIPPNREPARDHRSPDTTPTPRQDAATAPVSASSAERGSADAFAQLRQAVRSRKERSAPPPPPRPASVAGSLTVEQLVAEAVKPLLQEWLDEHLRGVVEELVADEIRRVTSEQIED